MTLRCLSTNSSIRSAPIVNLARSGTGTKSCSSSIFSTLLSRIAAYSSSTSGTSAYGMPRLSVKPSASKIASTSSSWLLYSSISSFKSSEARLPSSSYCFCDLKSILTVKLSICASVAKVELIIKFIVTCCPLRLSSSVYTFIFFASAS